MSPTCLVATVAEATHTALCAARDEHSRFAELVELRLDGLREPIDVPRALSGRRGPVIVTCRRRSDGGWFDGTEHQRREILRAAIAAGAEYVDLEWRSAVEDLAQVRGGRGIVLSMHDFDGMPGDLDHRLRAMLAIETEVVKIAVAVARLSDCIQLARLARSAPGRTLAVIGMGVAGTATRLLPARFGSSWTYAGASAPGQVAAALMLERYRVRDVGGSTTVYGVAGHPVTASLSPAIHNAWFRAAGIDAVYLPLDTDCADDLLEFAGWLPLAGFSVTAPIKRDMFHRVGARDAISERVGAVNTVRRVPGGWAATNTDVDGFRAPLVARGMRLRGCRAAILGSGGAARAVAVALARDGANVTVHTRTLMAAREVAEQVGGAADEAWPRPGAWDLLVNATPAGWESNAELLTAACAGACVYDLVSAPAVTPLLAHAAAVGCRTIPGVEMLVAQAEAQTAWWTGRRPDAGLMLRAAHDALHASTNNHVVGRGFSLATRSNSQP